MNPRSNIPPALMMQALYAPTSAGDTELAGGMTALSPAQLELLVRVDGTLSLAEVKQAMPHVEMEDFANTLRSLADLRLVQTVNIDPFQLHLQAQLDSFSQSAGLDGADASLLSLRRQGYYVQIARGQAAPVARRLGQPITALVVEDEPVLAKFIKTYLSFEGIQVRVAGNRAEIDAELGRRPQPDVVLLDVVLPDADGFEILSHLREHSAYQEVPVMMLTGKATRESVIRGIAGGASGYVTKPFQADALVRAVRTLLGLQPAAAAMDPWVNTETRTVKWQHKACA